MKAAGLARGLVLAALLGGVGSAAASSGRFVHPRSVPRIYHDGWIDLNKNGKRDVYEDARAPIDARIDDLLSRMSSYEKTAQLVTLYGYPRVLKDELPTPAWKQAFWKDGIGNIDEQSNGNTGWTHNLPNPKYDLPWSLHARALNEVQRFFVEDTRLGIPADFTDEGIRGVMHAKATSFPSELAVASTWDAPLVRQIGEVTGREARALGYTNVYSPVLDVARDPRWGRTADSYSEDPYLTGALGLQQVLGLQSQGVASTLKHYAAYSVPKGGRDGEARTDPQITWRELQTVFLPPFRKAVEQGRAMGVMASYNDYDGIPIEASKQFLTDILRGQWGFRGYVVSDSGAVEFIHTKHRTAATAEDAVRQAVEAGLDVRTNFTPPEDYAKLMRDLLRKGQLSMATIDARVRDVLRVKFELGLFDHPYVDDPAQTDRIVRSPANQAVAARASRESIILLKNDGDALPLSKKLRRVLVAGPLANNPDAWWSRYGPQQLDFVTPLAGIRAKLGAGVEVRYEKGVDAQDAAFPESDVYKDPPDATVRAGIERAVAAAQDVDEIIAVLGEPDALARESASRISLNLPGYQEELLQALAATGKPLVLVLSNGRPLSINWAVKHVPAIVEMWFPAEDAGNALADVLFGDYDPAGRLPVTMPKSVGQLPMNFPAHPGSQAHDGGQVDGVLYPFGHGLSYTRFAYSNLHITPQQQGPQGNIEVSFDVRNVGQRAGDEVAQLYLRDDYSSVIGFEKELHGFARVHLQPGETRTLRFTLGPDDLALYDRLHQWTVEPGRFTVMVGASSQDIRLNGGFDIVGDGVHEQAAPPTDTTDPR
ncbi:glycoside hydrolase family 3 N-terminal domain-containing protein [Solimonas marina]|uniref:Beta-D-glucoside glucohydrolase n=1 Tax=Solimonas marina TaxID=2714601 RepID=A0A969W7J0_9GAMM|nr:glycoside hydrolase family 3 N-terminal domain-containing protein [Solimonas marina]NKF22136.1 beta-glucosidase [Solimonas marina]